MPLISVLMGTYNEPEKRYVELAVNSILKQTLSDFEFIICDDGSEASFFTWLQGLCAKDSRIRLLRNRKNRGLAYTLNRCLLLARGKYIARMDADDISLPKRFEKQAAFLENHPAYAFAGCNAKLIENHFVWGERRLLEFPDKTSFLRTSPFVRPAVMMHKSVAKELHGYKQDRSMCRVEDYDFFMRVYAAGYAGYNLQEALLLYREDASALKKRKYRYRINECRVRLRGYRMLGILNGNLRYVIKPLMVGMVPARLMRIYRKKKYRRI